jgi:2,4-dienoyl-CoA reductase-like NADH-dependent reductase (Old Yellow Enzyme family)
VTPDLFTPLTIRGETFRNRIAVAPMCMYSVEDGMPGDWHLVHLGSRAMGGAGLVIAEATAVLPEGRITYGDTGIWSDAHADAFARVARFVSDQGATPGIQLAHAGRKASHRPPLAGGGPIPADQPGGWPVVSASAVPFQEGDLVPTALDAAGIERVVDAFEAAAVRSVRAGFRVIEIHAAHGYLLHQFLSPLVNRRTDEHGGSRENRMRLVLRVAERVRAAIPDETPLFLRLSATDWAEGGWDVEDSVALSRELKARGVDLIDVSSGGTVPDARIPVGPGYQVPFARRIREEAGIATGAVGLITEPEQAAGVVAEGSADLVLLAREMLRDAYWANHAAEALGAEPHWPAPYGYAVRRRK